jgi:hypothetical protein
MMTTLKTERCNESLDFWIEKKRFATVNKQPKNDKKRKRTDAFMYSFVLSFFALLTSRLTTYFLTLSSLERLRNFQILVARFGPSLYGERLSVSPGILFSPCLITTTERTAISGPTMQPQMDLCLRSPERRIRKHE